MTPKSPTPEETPTPKRRSRAKSEPRPAEPPLLEDKRFRGALVFLAAVAVFAAGYLIGHAAGSSEADAAGDGPVIGSDVDGERQGYIGVVGTDARRREGALILEVLPGSPADQAGLERGDLVVSANDRDLPSMRALAQLIRATHPGRIIELGVIRGDHRVHLEVRVGEQPGGMLGPTEQFPPPYRPEG